MASISSTSQPCRFEVIPNRPEQIVLDVCHNIDGFRAVLATIAIRFPKVDNIKFVFGISLYHYVTRQTFFHTAPRKRLEQLRLYR